MHAFKSVTDLLSTPRTWLSRTQTTILSAAVIITIANALSSVTGLLKERMLISFFFDTVESQLAYDAYLVAFQIPDLLFQLIILGAVSSAFIPVFKELTHDADEQSAFQMTNAVSNILLLIFIALSLVVVVFAHPITVWRTGASFTPEQIDITARLTRIMLISQVFFGFSNIFSSMLQSYRRFIVPAISPIFYNLGIVLGAYLLKDMVGIEAAAYGVVIGAFLHMLLQLPFVLQTGWRWRPTLNWRAPGVSKLFALMPPRVLTYGLTQMQEISLGFLATSLPMGLGYFVIRQATRVMALPIRFFGVAIGQAALPFLAEVNNPREVEKFRGLLLQSLNQITYLTLPASVLILILRVPIVRLVFGASNVPWATTLDIGRVLALLIISVAAQASVQLLIRGFHALQDTRTPLLVTLMALAVYLSGTSWFVFGSEHGLLGIAAMTSLVGFLEFYLFVFLMHHKIGGVFQKSLFVPQAKMYLAAFLMGIFLYLPFRILDEVVFDTSRTIELIALTITTGTIGMLSYLYFSALLEIRELTLITRAIPAIGRWRLFASKTDETIIDPSGDDEGL